MIVLLLADGFEEIEALLPVDLLRRAGADIKTVAINGNYATGSHGIKVFADMSLSELDISKVTDVIFPGGMPGATNLDECEQTDKIIDAVIHAGGRIAAICAAPLILGRRGLLSGKRAVCYPGFENELVGAIIDTANPVVTDGNITTAKGMGAALPFAKELVRLLCKKSDEEMKLLSSSIMEF